MYLTYDEYKGYGGTLSDTEFNRFNFRAECEINNATFDRCKSLTKIPEIIKRCQFELVVFLSKNARGGSNSSVSSFSNDGYSVSYTDKKTAQEQISDIIYTYLASTDLMYCGADGPIGTGPSLETIPEGYSYLLVKDE